MGEVMLTVVVGLLRGVAFLVDCVTKIPWYIYDNPHVRRKQSRRIKAKPLNGSPGDPWRTVDSFDTLTTTPFEECKTLDELFARAVRLYGSNECLGTRQLLAEEDEVQKSGKVFKKVILGEYEWQTFDEVMANLTALGSGLLALGQRPRQNICIFAETRAEWMLAAQACFKYNFPVVTLYASLGEDAIVHGINEAEVTHVITSSDLLPKFKAILSRMSNVKHLIYMEAAKRPDLSDFPSNVKIHSLSQVKELGSRPKNISTPVTKPQPNDIAVIMYTSGSTGLPKGVMIAHCHLMAGMSGQIQRVPNLGPEDTYIGYLPLAHVLELSAEIASLSHGVRIGYSSPLTLSDQSSKIKRGSKGDASVLRPTLMAAVPVIMDRLYKAVWDKVNDGGFISQALFRFAYGYKRQRISRGYDTPLLNKIVFKKTSTLLGGRIRLMLSGGAPLSADTQRFMNICFCCPVGQGYGLTETCGAGTVHEVTDLSTGRVGAPLQCNQIKLLDWEEGGYTINDKPFARGEIIVGGHNVTLGYYKNPEKTAEEFYEKDGLRWFCTGDIGEFQADGCLKIIDRKKDLVKLQTGEYVSLAKVETALKMCPLVDNICIYADSSKMFTVCLAVPNHKQLLALATKIGLGADEEWESMCQNQELEQMVLKTLQQEARKARLERFEVPQKIKLCSELWTPDSGLVTDAFKLKRKPIQMRYETEISRMYA